MIQRGVADAPLSSIVSLTLMLPRTLSTTSGGVSAFAQAQRGISGARRFWAAPSLAIGAPAMLAAMTDPTTVELITELYALVGKLEKRFAHHGRRFTPDGHMVGSIGEALAADMFGLQLMDASNHGYDAVQGDRRVEIKVTQGTKGVLLYADAAHLPSGSEPTHLVALKIHPDRAARGASDWVEVVYNGPAMPVWAAASKPSKTSQQLISLTRLRAMNASVADEDRIKLL